MAMLAELELLTIEKTNLRQKIKRRMVHLVKLSLNRRIGANKTFELDHSRNIEKLLLNTNYLCIWVNYDLEIVRFAFIIIVQKYLNLPYGVLGFGVLGLHV